MLGLARSFRRWEAAGLPLVRPSVILAVSSISRVHCRGKPMVSYMAHETLAPRIFPGLSTYEICSPAGETVAVADARGPTRHSMARHIGGRLGCSLLLLQARVNPNAITYSSTIHALTKATSCKSFTRIDCCVFEQESHVLPRDTIFGSAEHGYRMLQESPLCVGCFRCVGLAMPSRVLHLKSSAMEWKLARRLIPGKSGGRCDRSASWHGGKQTPPNQTLA